jgi:hypothetical protein
MKVDFGEMWGGEDWIDLAQDSNSGALLCKR